MRIVKELPKLEKCKVCGKKPEYLSRELGVCLDCIRTRFDKAKPHIERAQRRVREEFKLPIKPPKDKGGIQCNICVNECKIGEGKVGYCGIRKNIKGKFYDWGGGALNFYYDNLPTNCVADFVCPAGTGCAYPKFAYTDGPEYGYKNLAVFYGACSFNCLFCQNWHYREHLVKPNIVTAEELASQVDEKTSCICYFGGDPTPQIHHAIQASKIAVKRKKGKILRICFETNGSMNPAILKQAADIALESGGCIKVDIKAWDEGLHKALTGITNKRTLENFEMLAKTYNKKRKEPPFLVASSLLIPGYIDKKEIGNIAKFIAKLDPNIPYSLLAFCPQFYMYDLPTTSKEQAYECRDAALAQGVKNVRIGNIHLLS